DLIVIEMNPRVSRSSALASKATGFPIAKVAAKLAVGYTLDELDNDITGGATPASFEPTIDYVVTKIPRFTFEKFPGADPSLTTSMKSVGEAMAIGGTFAESLQKGLRSMETGLTGLNEVTIEGLAESGRDAVKAAIAKPRSNRLLVIAQAFREGLSVEEVNAITHFDPWFLDQIKHLIEVEGAIRTHGLPKDAIAMLGLKKLGFSDARLAELTGTKESYVRSRRQMLGVRPVYRRVDTCAAEFPSPTPYMYSAYEGDGIHLPQSEARVSDRRKVVILGGGPNRVGQGIEFDYCCVHAAYALKEMGIEAIMVNCNPETVSTDYDTSDRLYFEPLTAEDVIELIATERAAGTLLGVIVQFGGQTPLKLAHALEKEGIPILGTSPDAIDLAEDRERFQTLLQDLNLKQPANGIARSEEEAVDVADKVGYPLVIRPSYVLGGRAMEIVHDRKGLERYMREAVHVSGKSPVLLDSYLQDAVEVDVDALCDGAKVYIAGVMEHIEEAGIHSGDSACSLPAHSLSAEVVAEIRAQAEKLAIALQVRGLMNVQFAVKDGVVYILEVNPRASRTVPFVAKATGLPVAKLAARIMAGETLDQHGLEGTHPDLGHVAVKEAVFPFARFPGVDIILGPEMKSTGEVMGIDTDFGRAFAKSQMGAGSAIPSGGTAFISVKDRDKAAAGEIAAELVSLGFKLMATSGTATYLRDQGLDVESVLKVQEGRPHCVDRILSGDVQMVINTTEGQQAVEDSFSIRRTALTDNIPHYTTIAAARAAVRALIAIRAGTLAVTPLQAYFKPSF
ncbi:MAG: carbamoyl-phosphate synthase large subunit, partial [Rhodospirillales bacterium]